MEAAGLAVGVVALSGLFNNVVDCFEYIQIGKAFGKDFQTSIIKLDIARLQLLRWGQSIGLGASTTDATSLQEATLSPESVKSAEEILGQIEDLFTDAETISKRYAQRTRGSNRSSDASLEVCDVSTDLDPVPSSLHQKMQKLSIRRQSHTGIRQKAKWALYEKKTFSRLIEDITDLVQSLVDLFPAQRAALRALCDSEVASVDREEDLRLLKHVAKDQDALLSNAIAKVARPSVGTSYTSTNTGANYSGLQIGQNIGSINGFRWNSEPKP